MEQKLVHNDGTIDGDTFDWHVLTTHIGIVIITRSGFPSTLLTTLRQRPAMLRPWPNRHAMALHHPLATGPPLVVMTPVTHVSGINLTITPTPDPRY